MEVFLSNLIVNNMSTLEIIDVTIIEPRRKHPTIFEKFDSLTHGEGLVIHNDHDPKPLYYQLLAERGPIFEWVYVAEGPEIWQVKISKLPEGEKEKTVGQIVKEDYRKAEVFKKFGIDFCCGGKKAVTKACAEKGIDVVQLEKELKEVDNSEGLTASQDYNSWDLDFLADYIVNTHHKYVIQSNPIIFEYTQKIARVHGQRHPELLEIANVFVEVMNELGQHMMKEEQVLFPYIKSLVEAKSKNLTLESYHFGTVLNPINMMVAEHEAVHILMDKIRNLTNNYTLPQDACTSYSICFKQLQQYELDLYQHIHLENNILFPKAVALEEELTKANS